MGGTQSSYYDGISTNCGQYEEDRFVNENMRRLQDGLGRQPKREMPSNRKEFNARAKERIQEHQRRQEHRSARLSNIQRQWSVSQMANSSINLIDSDDQYQSRWNYCCCGLFPP